MTVVGAGALAVIGLLLGSLVDGLVRAADPGRQGWILSRPRCPECAVPLTGWLWLPLIWAAGPRLCPACGVGLGWRRWWLEAVTGAVCAGTALVVGPTWALPAFQLLALVCVALAAIDIAVHRVPDRLLMPASAAFWGLLTIAAAAGGQWQELLRAAAGGVLAFTLYLLLALAGGGMGDAKLALLIGAALAWLGWDAWLVGVAAAPVLAALWVAVAGRGKPRVGSTVAFAPFMATAALLGALAGSQLVAWYLDLRASG